MKDYLNCKSIDTAILRAKNGLVKKVKSKGIYENFGKNEQRDIENKFIDSTDYYLEMNQNRDKLKEFSNWCSTYTGK